MHTYKLSVVLLLLTVGVIFGATISIISAAIVVNDFRADAVQRGYAEYNATNGFWQWKE